MTVESVGRDKALYAEKRRYKLSREFNFFCHLLRGRHRIFDCFWLYNNPVLSTYSGSVTSLPVAYISLCSVFTFHFISVFYLQLNFKMHLFELSAFENQEAHSEEDFRFEKSLKELKDLRSQLHYAADYCETTFLKVKEKKDVLENTKEYICRALVTVVDHLGSVSSKLEHRISDTHDFAEAELRISALKQRLLSCELYAHKLALNKVKWTAALPSYHRRYLSAITDVAKSNEDSRDLTFTSAAKVTFKQGFDIEEVPLFMYTYSDKLSPVKIPPSKTAMESCDSDTPVVLPVRDGVSNSILSKGPNPTFHFQLGSPKLGRKSFQRKTLQSAEIMSLIRRIKRTP